MLGFLSYKLALIINREYPVSDIQKSWRKIIQCVKNSHKPIFVCTNNTQEVTVLNFEEFKTMQKIIEATRREQLGQQMVCDLLDIAQFTGQPIKHMLLNSKGVFEETEEQ